MKNTGPRVRPGRWGAAMAVALLVICSASDAFAARSVSIGDVRHRSYADYTRIVMSITGNAPLSEMRLDSPDRVLIDISGCRIGGSREVPVGDTRLNAIRMAQYDAETVRVVLDLRKAGGYKVFTLEGPARVVIDLYDKTPEGAAAEAVPGIRNAEKPGPIAKVAVGGATPVAAKAYPPAIEKPAFRRIVIDPGHGGKDPGAIGRGGIMEKDITLKIARELRKVLEKQGGYEVFLTRDRDVYLDLDARTQYANRVGADLFVSVHVNAHADHDVAGIETYLLNFASDKTAQRVAERENAIFLKRKKQERSDVEVILASLGLQNKVDESLVLAHAVQGAIVSSAGAGFGEVRDLGVKQALFYVLLGARMPSVLVETAYITNPTEAKRLKDARYQRNIASGIAAGIKAYFEQQRPVDRLVQG